MEEGEQVFNIRRQYEAFMDTFKTITLIIPHDQAGGEREFSVVRGDTTIPLEIEEEIQLERAMKIVTSLPGELDLEKACEVVDANGIRTDLQVGAVIRTAAFDERYYYEGEDLGVRKVEGGFRFKLWAPTSSAVKLKLISKNGEEAEHDMTREDKGVWTLEIQEDVEGSFYSYLTCINLVWKEALDPYAVAVSFNSRWGVVATELGPPCTSLPPVASPVDAIIYELHVRDFSAGSEGGMKARGRYGAFSERGTKTPGGYSSGVDYLKELGITHVELLPVNDFGGVPDDPSDEEYNWGYNPLFFNVPEGSYSSDPGEPLVRIRELKEVVNNLHDEGIRVIMDVVYNHVFIREESSFEKIVPGYFFRHGENGLPSNGTGVGNDFASERLMARKFIKDSIRFWINEYGFDGFRFDLMGILDVTTMNEVSDLARDSGLIVIGEGWDLNTPIPQEEKANLRNARSIPDVGQFNDWFRDTVKGSTFNLHDKGFILGHSGLEKQVAQVLSGSVGIQSRDQGIFDGPIQSVNYIESHDNHTLWDKMKACMHESEEQLFKRQSLGTAMVLLSQGIPFIHAGQEFYRTKGGHENSYNAPVRINQLDWTRREEHEKAIAYVRGLIDIRKAHGAFRFPEARLIREHVSIVSAEHQSVVIRYSEVGDYGPWSEMILAFNGGTEPASFALGEGERWRCLAKGDRADADGLFTIEGDQLEVAPLTVSVAVMQSIPGKLDE